MYAGYKFDCTIIVITIVVFGKKKHQLHCNMHAYIQGVVTLSIFKIIKKKTVSVFNETENNGKEGTNKVNYVKNEK